MKLVLVALATIAALGSALPAPATRGLTDDLDKFIALIPKEQILGIAMDYLANDAEVQEAITFLTSDDFKSLVLEVESLAEYKSFVQYLQAHGLDVLAVIKKLHEILDLPEYAPARVQTRRGAGIRGLLDDIEAALPIDDLKALFYETLKTSPDFANLVNVLKGDEFKGLVAKLRTNPKFQEIVVHAKEQGVDIELIVDLLNKIFGWGIESRRLSAYGLQDDLQDFLALIPTDKIIAIVIDYLANDNEVQDILVFFQSEYFKDLVKDIDIIPEYIKFLDIVQSKGLDVYGLVNKLHEMLGLPTLPMPSRAITRKVKGVRGLIDDIEAVLPIDQLEALFQEKLDNSPDFASLINYMKSEEFQTIIKALRTNPKFEKIVNYGKEHCVDVQGIADLLKKVFGWDFGY